VVGFVSFETLDVLFSVDARFKRVYERNYFMLLIAWVKIAVPFLMSVFADFPQYVGRSGSAVVLDYRSETYPAPDVAL
jgi:hypothetical protein